MIPAVSDSHAHHHQNSRQSDTGACETYQRKERRGSEQRSAERRNPADRRSERNDRRVLFISLPAEEERRGRYSDRRQTLLDRRHMQDRRGALHKWKVFPVSDHLATLPERPRVGTRLDIEV